MFITGAEGQEFTTSTEKNTSSTKAVIRYKDGDFGDFSTSGTYIHTPKP